MLDDESEQSQSQGSRGAWPAGVPSSSSPGDRGRATNASALNGLSTAITSMIPAMLGATQAPARAESSATKAMQRVTAAILKDEWDDATTRNVLAFISAKPSNPDLLLGISEDAFMRLAPMLANAAVEAGLH